MRKILSNKTNIPSKSSKKIHLHSLELTDINTDDPVNLKYLSLTPNYSNLPPRTEDFTSSELQFYLLTRASDEKDILMYNDDRVFENHIALENTIKNPVNENITPETRAMLVDWVIGVHHTLNLTPETLYLAITIIDRFISRSSISLHKLQLVGTVALFIASKYEEITYPSISTFISLAESDDETIRKAERFMLHTLDWTIFPSMDLSFMRRCSRADNYDPRVRALSRYLRELAMYDQNLSADFNGTLVSVACVYLSRKMLQVNVNPQLFLYLGVYTKNEILVVARRILRFLGREGVYENVRKKYGDERVNVVDFLDRYVKLYLVKRKRNKLNIGLLSGLL